MISPFSSSASAVNRRAYRTPPDIATSLSILCFAGLLFSSYGNAEKDDRDVMGPPSETVSWRVAHYAVDWTVDTDRNNKNTA